MLFTTNPFSGHFHPLYPVAATARAAGHEVAFATGTDYEPVIRRLGFGYYPAGLNPGDPEVLAIIARGAALPGIDNMLFVLTELILGLLAEHMAPDLERVLAQFRPDIVVSEVTEFVGPILAERSGLPAVSLHFGVIHPREGLAAVLGPKLSSLRERIGLDPLRVSESIDRALVLAFATPSYQIPGMELPSNVFLFRPRVFDRSGDEDLPAWVEALRGKPIVYGTMGTVPAFNERPGVLRAVVDAMSACDVHGIVTVGRNQDPTALGTLPSNVHVARYIPQSTLLDRCSAVIGHGGYGTTMGALCFGVPLVVVPLGADQPVHAMRCASLGVGEVVEPQGLNPDVLAKALRRVLTEASYRERAQAFRAELDAMPPMEEAIAKIEQFAA
jgi:UDP:flavonoid glycosyltransferase YjiC (YdhE family)